MENQIAIIDYLFAGAGASATLLLMSLDKRNLLDGKNIVIIDPDTKLKNDKTYCFWENSDDSIVKSCNHLISYEWDKVSVNANKPEFLEPMKYFHISSIDLYNELQKIIKKYNILRIHNPVVQLKNTNYGVEVKTKNETIASKLVFDSRPPSFLPLKTNETHLRQSFLGYVISVDNNIPNPNCIDLMDFKVEQNDSTQFVYVLPFSEKKLLVELTRFGVLPLKPKDAEPIFNEYITNRYGNYKIVAIEIGSIPMCNAKIDTEHLPNVISIGGRAGAIKPSTGYAFKNMFIQAENIAESIQNNFKFKVKNNSSRFKFYDRLLLLILSQQPHLGKPIFLTLFQKNKIQNVMKFMDEKTSILQDIKILSSLPFKPFLKAWMFDATFKAKALFIPNFLIVLALGLMGLNAATPTLFKWVEPILFFLGLLSVGIPHGAVDHLLESGNLNSKIKPYFVLRYLGAAFIYFTLWMFFPNIALLGFLIYSIWHFGQGDMNEWQLKNTLKKWTWGLFIFGIILYGHSNETNSILNNMGVTFLAINENIGTVISFWLIIFAFAWGIWEQKTAMILSCILLTISIQLPLITSFGLYFIGQHSLHGWSHLKKGLFTNNISLFKKAFPFTAAAFLMFALLILCFENGYLTAFEGELLTAFFVFISCISFLHVITMHLFYKKILKV